MSLRSRLLLAMGVVALVLLATGGAISRLTERSLVEQLDEQLERAAPALRPERRSPGLPGDASRPPSALYVGVLDVDADALTPLFEPTTTANAAPPDLGASEAATRAGQGAFTVAAADGDLRYRVRVRDLPRTGNLLVTAAPMEDVDATLDRLRRLLLLGSLATVGTLGLVTWWVLRLGVRPIREMTGAAVAIGEGDLSQRIPPSAAGTEAAALGVALNHMLGRIEAAFDERARSEERLRRFAADASHELRTPLATIRGYAELYRHGGLADDAALADAMRRTEQEAERMSTLVNDLLVLARFDQGRPVDRRPVDLVALATDAVADARVVDPSRPIDLQVADPAGAARVAGDEDQLRQVFANLLANVRVHTPPDTPVTVSIARAVGSEGAAGGAGGAAAVVIEVHDDGPGMAPEAAGRAFERFYRADPSRTRVTGGSGLGLSIVAAVAEAHGGSAALTSVPGRGTTVRVVLPAHRV